MSADPPDPYPAGPTLVRPRLSPSEFLRLTHDLDREQVYLLQATDRRLTIHAQQVRALNLVFSLVEEKAPLKTMAIVGAGFAGLTAAVAAARLGSEVTVYEARPELLHLQSGSDTRWVHPHIYDWPDPIATVPSTDLPFLNWTTATASEVAEIVLLDFFRHKAQLGPRLKVELSSPATLSKSKKAEIVVKGVPRKFGCVLLATGFGVERTLNEVPFRSYWMCDALHQADMHAGATSSNPASILISGTGDGGLIDVLRAKLRNFRQDRLALELFDEAQSEIVELKQTLKELREKILKQDSAPERLVSLQLGYAEIERSAGFAEIRRRIRERIRTDTKVYLHGLDQTFLSPNASILHTFLAYVLVQEDGFEYVPEPITKTTPHNGEWQVELENRSPLFVREIVVRHGPKLPKDNIGQAVDSYRQSLKPDRIIGLERTAVRVENNTNEWWYSHGVPRPEESRTQATASQQREQMTSTRRTSALLEEAVTLQRNAFIRSAISEFIGGPLYDAYYELIYAYSDDDWKRVRQIVETHFGTSDPLKLFDLSRKRGKREECWRKLESINADKGAPADGRRRYHPAFFQTSEEERRLDQILEYFDVIGSYHTRGLIKREDLEPLLAYLLKLSSRKVVRYYLDYLKALWDDGRGKKLEPKLPFANVRELIAQLEVAS